MIDHSYLDEKIDGAPSLVGAPLVIIKFAYNSPLVGPPSREQIILKRLAGIVTICRV